MQPQPKSKQKNCIEEKWKENGDYSLPCLKQELLLDHYLYSTFPFTTTCQTNFEIQGKNWWFKKLLSLNYFGGL